MSAPTLTVEVALGVPADTDFILDDPTRGVLDGDFTLSSGYTEVTSDSVSASITRGRFTQLWDAVDAGTCTIRLNNEDRDYDPAHVTSPYAGFIVPGRGVRVSANDVVIFTGFVDDWDLDYDVSGRSTASLISTDALGMLGQMQFDAWTSTATNASGKLLQSLTQDEVAWPGLVDFDNGVELMQSENVSWGSNVLNYCQLIARTDLGYFYAAADGCLKFRDRTVGNGASVATFGGDVGFQGIGAQVGSDLLFARVGVDREGGTNQTATVDDLTVWRAQYGPTRSLSLTGLLFADDAQSLALADYLLSLHDRPRYRIAEITVMLHGLSESDQDDVLAIDITDVITVSFTPNGVGDAIVQPLLVQGIRHDMSPSAHSVTFSLTDAAMPYFRLDSADYGVLDVNQLAF